MPGLEFGIELPDKVEKISSISEVQVDLIGDLREVFRERAVIEREYASKLQVLAKKAVEKKSKRMSRLVLGDEPTHAWTEDTVKTSTFDKAYSKLLSSLENGAQDHMVLADSLTSQVVEELKKLERKNEETRKKQSQFYEKLISDRDRTSSDRLKAKSKYDEECMEVESYRHKQDRASDDKHAERAAKQLEQQKIDMLNAKNTYLIATSIANETKNKFYAQDLPLLENQFQSIQAHLITSLTAVLSHSQSLHTTHLASLQSHVTTVETALSQIDATKDQDLFVEYNRDTGIFKIPDNWRFEPCEGFYDTGEASVDPVPKVFLQNKLSRCRAKLSELDPVLDAKRREAEKLEGVVSAYKQDRSLGNLDEVRDNLLEAQRQLTHLATSQTALNAEIVTISLALGDDEGAQSPHSFKSSSFSIPTQCGYCKSSIWGLSKQGKTCKLCNLSVHSRCELKVPAECPRASGGSHVRSSASISRAPSRLPAQSEPPTPSSFSRPHASAAPEEGYPSATVLFSFGASSPFELTVTAGEPVQLLEEDDGSGWVKIADSKGGKGLVPASYVQLSEDSGNPEKASTSPTTMPLQGCGKYVRVVYAYESQGADELPLHEGDTIELSAGPSGGENYANGWWEGFDSTGRKGIFPSNYVEPA